MNKILTIAGSDCSGGAGIQADIKTIMAHGAYAMSVVTALTAQNTTGVFGIREAGADFIGAQLDAVFSDIVPDAVKIGMVCDEASVSAIARRLRRYGARSIVIDPVTASSSGTKLMREGVLEAAERELFPLAFVLTPNIPEAEILASAVIKDRASMQQAARRISQKYGCAVLCKGGHQADAADDLLYEDGHFYWFAGRHIDNPNTHGTGCTLSSAIACGLADGMCLKDAVRSAKQYLTEAILDGLNLGHGSGPLNHGYRIRKEG